MKDDSAYHHLQPRNPRSRYLPPETAPVYGTPPLERPLSFADIAPPGHIVNSSSCSTFVSSFNDLSNLDPNCLRHPKAVQHPSTLIQHSCQFAMDQNFIPSSDCTNYTSPFDTGRYDLLFEDTTAESLFTASRFGQNIATSCGENFNQSVSYPRPPPAHLENMPSSRLQFHDEQQSPSRQHFSFSNPSVLSMERLSSNLGRTGFPLSPEDSPVSSPSEESNNFHLSPEPMATSAGQILSDGESDDEKSDEPYSKLIWRALQSVPDNKMTLKEIYEWFEKNTNKARNSDSKGWQNSIRHNLSMNAAFEGVKDTSSPDGTPRKTANVWVLTKEALQNGVQSTTRYRKVGSHKKLSKLEHPAPQRQRSGAKGGKAAKKTSKMRRVKQDPHAVETANRSAAFYNYQPRDDNTMIPNFHYRPQLFSGHSGGFTLDNYGLENVIGTHPVSDLHDSSVLSDPLFSESNGFSTLF
ncbi:forkhead domain-containing protein [Histoplasma ohiense]|nr:forkhead domain-containing protein [Histoplasma ohiense (nom. inval.)]